MDSGNPSRILLIKPSALGDIVHTLPVLSALRSLYPQAHLAWLVNRSYEPLLRDHPHLDEIIPFDRFAARSGLWRGLRSWVAFAKNLRQQRFDCVLDLQGLFRSGILTRITGAPRRIGSTNAREGSRWFYTEKLPIPSRNDLHAVDRYWRFIEHLGGGHLPKRFILPIAGMAAVKAETLLSDWPRPWLMLGAGSRWLTKRWPPEHFANLANRARTEFGGTTVLVGTADESSIADVVQRRLTGPSLNLVGRTTLAELVAILARADVMLANDTGPLHIAAALGKSVVAPYTCTKANLTGPYGLADRVVETKVWCAGSYRRSCSRMECMSELTPDRLWPILREGMQSWGRQQNLSA
jgi:lipopolysaccharide heptosyltransferase I